MAKLPRRIPKNTKLGTNAAGRVVSVTRVVGMTPDWFERLRALVDDLEQAARADEMKGGAHPEDMDVIGLEYQLAKARLENFLLAAARELK